MSKRLHTIKKNQSVAIAKRQKRSKSSPGGKGEKSPSNKLDPTESKVPTSGEGSREFSDATYLDR